MIASTWRYPADAYHWLLSTIAAKGDLMRSEDGKLCREVCNLAVTIQEPLSGWPVAGSGWDLPALDEYAGQLLNPDPGDFSYTYGARLFDYETHYHAYSDGTCSGPCIGIDQIGYAIDKLKEHPTTRRAVAITWNPDIDPDSEHVPCLQIVDFLLRNGRLSLTAFFRSWDASRAAPANLYGLGRLLLHVAGQVGADVGSLTVVAASGHVYEV